MIFTIVFFIFGLIVGSFLNALIWRWPRNQRLTGRSACPRCGQELKSVDLVPLISFLLLKGRCRFCRRRISPRYPLIELATALLFAAVAAKFAPHDLATWLLTLRSLVVVSVLVAVFVIDLEHYLILDRLVIPAALTVLVFNIIIDSVAANSPLGAHSLVGGGVLSALLISAFFLAQWLVSSGRWIGLGDVKFGLFLGLALGWPASLVGLLGAYALGAAAALPLLVYGKKNMNSQVPFGVFLSAAALIAILWGGHIATWYLGLINWR